MTTSPAGSGQVIPVAASINAWGSILEQLGGTHAKETSLIANPDTDPHDYEPTPADGRVIAGSKLFVENGIGTTRGPSSPWRRARTPAGSCSTSGNSPRPARRTTRRRSGPSRLQQPELHPRSAGGGDGFAMLVP
jgi:hypothetical protein